MNRKRNVQKFLIIALVVLAMLSLVPSAQAKKPTPPTPSPTPPSTAWTSLWYTRSGCVYTYTVQWSAQGAKTLELWIEENGIRIAPTHFEAVNSSSGTITYTFPSLTPSATQNDFHGWAPMLDSNGVTIPGTLIFRVSTFRIAPPPDEIAAKRQMIHCQKERLDENLPFFVL